MSSNLTLFIAALPVVEFVLLVAVLLVSIVVGRIEYRRAFKAGLRMAGWSETEIDTAYNRLRKKGGKG